MHSAVHGPKDVAEESLLLRLLAISRMQLRDPELGLAPLEHLRRLDRARVVRAHVNGHL